MAEHLLAAGLVLLAALAPGCLGGPEPPELPATEAWPEGASIFEDDPAWKGGDGAQTIAVGEDRILWLFGDSLVQPPGSDAPRFVHNTVAIQDGTDPSKSSFEAAWRTETVEEEGDLPEPVGEDETRQRPTAFFPNESSEVWYWPGAPALVDGELVVFANRVRDAGEGPFGFEAAGWRVFEVDGHERAPEEWTLERVDPPIEDHGFTVGIAALVDEGHLYAYGQRAAQEGEFTVHEVALARWSVDAVREGDWERVEWWTGEAFEPEPAQPAVLFSTLGASFTVHEVDGELLFTAMEGIGTGNVTVRAGPAPEGPFSQPAILHAPEEDPSIDHQHYAARLHPELTGGDWITTWHDSRFDRPRMARAAPG